MKKLIVSLYTFCLVIGVIATNTDVQAQTKAYRVSDKTVQTLLARIEQSTDRFNRSLDNSLDRSAINNTDSEEMIMNYVTEFENATDKLKQRFDAKESIAADVENVLSRAAAIDGFMNRNRLSVRTEGLWVNIKNDLNTLARYYNVTWDWNKASMNNTGNYKKPYRVSDNNVQNLLSRIETKTDRFKRSLDNALDRTRMNNTDSEEMIMNYVTEFENATDRLKQRFDAKESIAADVENVLSRATAIDGFMNRNRLASRAETSWVNVKNDLNTLAGYYSVNWDWNKAPVSDGNANLAYTVSASNVQSLLTGLETKTDDYKRLMNSALDRSVLNNSRSEDAIVQYITEFENATDRLKQNFDARKSTDKDVMEVLSKASNIDSFMRDYRLLNSAERQWSSIKNDLNTLSNYYSVNWNWNRQYEPMSQFDSMLSGTYKLNTALSDNVDAVVENSVKIYPARKEDRVENNLKRRLESPDIIVIQKNNMDITVASSNAPQVTFKADGVTRQETNPSGRNIKISAVTTYDGVSLNYEGERMNDFYVNFMPLSDRRLRVIRRINLERNNETVTVASVYDKVSQTPQWDMVRGSSNVGTNTGNDATFAIPNGTQVMAVLRNEVSTKASQDGDRFTMEVTTPSQFQGAIIEGHVVKAERSGRVSGRANVSLDFDTIRLRNGQTYKFAGIIDSVTLASGEKVTVNNEGAVRDNNQTNKTITRAGIGAGVGAILGAILGGGQGAAIGAAIGAAGGAGTVIAQGRDDVELEQGTQFMITASAPNSTNDMR